MITRVVDATGKVIATGTLARAWRSTPPLSLNVREGVGAVEHGSQHSGAFGAPMRIAHATVKLEAPQKMPLWYGGYTYELWNHLDFSLPSGLHNVWGQGNDFDTDAYSIYPEDAAKIMALLKDSPEYSR